MTPQPLPKAAVQVSRGHCLVVNRRELENLEFAPAVGGHNGGDVANLLADQAAADGRCGGDQALVHIGFLAGDQLIGDLFILGGIEDHDGGAEGDSVPGNIG